MMDRFKCYLDSLSPHKKKNKKKTSDVKVWQNFLDPRMVAYIDDAHVGPMIVHEVHNLLIFLFDLICCCFCT